MALDLNQLRKVIIDNNLKGEVLPTNPSEQVVVDQEGRVLIGNQARPGEILTIVPQETFAALG